MEGARSSFSLKGVEVGDLADIRTLSIDSGHYYHIETPLEDKTNENSCAITYYEVGMPDESDIKKRLTNFVVMQFLQEPFFNDLRTQQQLGYVVFSKACAQRDVIGVQFMVQSPTKSCGYITNAINNFLAELKEKAEQMSDKEFEVYR